MALVHDMGESLVGDITPLDNIEKSEKSRRETESMDYLTRQLLGNVMNGGAAAGQGIRDVWQEYEDNKTLEAKFVHDVDKVELLLQMVEYEKNGRGQIDLGEFVHVGEGVKLEETKQWCKDILRERANFWMHLGKGPDSEIKGLKLGEKVMSIIE